MAQDVLSDGFVKLCIDPSLNFYGGLCRVLIEGPQGQAGGTVANDTVVAVPSTKDLDTMFGANSALSVAIRKALCICPNNIELYAIARDPAAGGGTAAVYTLKVDAAPTADGILDVFLFEGDWSFSINIEAGQTVTQVRDLILAEISNEVPFVVTSTGTDTITFTATAVGEIGNGFTVKPNWNNRTDTYPDDLVITWAQPTVATGNTTALGDPVTETGVCCYSCILPLYADVQNQKKWQDYIKDAWDCSKPQCFGHVYLWVTGTLGQVLAKWTNEAGLTRYAHSANDDVPGWMRSVVYGALSCCSACLNPELNIQGRNFGVLNCLRYPASCVAGWTTDEQTELRANGFVVMGPLGSAANTYTNPYVFNDVTQYLYDDQGRANETFRDVSSRRLATSTAIALATELQQYSGLALFRGNTKVKQGVFGTNKRLLLAAIRGWAKENVGVLFSEFDNIDRDIQVLDDFQVAAPCTGKPGKLYLNMVYRPPVRIKEIAVKALPKLFDNCDR